MPRFALKDICPDSQLFREDGQKVRDEIERALKSDDSIEIDFEQQIIASISLFDQGIASLFIDYDADLIRAKLKISGLNDSDRNLLNDLVRKRISQRSRPA